MARRLMFVLVFSGVFVEACYAVLRSGRLYDPFVVTMTLASVVRAKTASLHLVRILLEVIFGAGGGHGAGIRGAGFVAALLAISGCMAIQVQDPQVRYIAFGDSTTAGPSTRDYPDLLRESLGEEPRRFANEGRGGETTERGLARLRALLADDTFPNAEVLLYWEGGKDVTDFIQEHDRLLLSSPDDPDYAFVEELEGQLNKTQGNIQSAIAVAQHAGLEVYVATYFFLREDVQDCGALSLNLILPAHAHRANTYVVRLNEVIRSAVARRGAILVDVAAEDDIIRASQENYHDCNHLNEQGNTIVAKLFLDALTASPD